LGKDHAVLAPVAVDSLSYRDKFETRLPVPVYASEVTQVPRHCGVTHVAPRSQCGNGKTLIVRDVQKGEGELQGNGPVYRAQRLKRLFHPSGMETGLSGERFIIVRLVHVFLLSH